jgi:hypothetical protein
LDVAVDENGSPYITGYALSEIDFGDGVLSPPGDEEVFVASYDASANHRWSRVYGGFRKDGGRAIGVADGGQTYVTGYYNHSFTFDGTDYSVSHSFDDMFILSIDP